MELKQLVLDKREEGKLVYLAHEGPMSIAIEDFLKQPVDGILYDLNRLEEVSLTFMDKEDGLKWVNDFAVALTIRALYETIERLNAVVSAVLKEGEHSAGIGQVNDTTCEVCLALEKLPPRFLEDD